MKTALLKLALVSAFLVLGAFTATGLIPDDGDGDGVPDSVDVCPNEDSSPFDRDGDGCTDEFIGGRHIEYWGEADASISYVINEQGVPSITNGSDLTAVQSAVSSWTTLPNTELSVVYGGTTTQTNSNGLDRVNLVTFVDNAYPFSNLVLAVGLSTSFEADTLIDGRVYRQGEIFDADMVFNPNKAFKVGGQGPGTDIQSVATHEAGHLFGISHSAIQSSTMFYVLPGGFAARTLEPDDRLVYRKAYTDPATLATTNRIDGVVTDGQTDEPVPGVAVFVKSGGDTAAVDYTLPDGSFSFPGLPDGSYTVWIHAIDGTSEVGFIQPANINTLIQQIAVANVVPEGYSDPESNTDDAFLAEPLSLNAGNRVRTIEFVTNIDAVAPLVTASNPGNNANNVAIDAAYIITFSEEIDINTIVDNFAFRDIATNQRQAGNIGIIDDARKIVFTPSPPLAFETQYRLRLETGLKDEFGNSLVAPFTLDITTEDEPPIGISSLSPNKGVAGTTVVITGNGFELFPLPTVKFGTETAAISHSSPTTLVVEVPATAQTGQVTVTNPDNQVSNPLTFTVLSAAEVARGFESGQTLLGDQPNAIAVVPSGGYAYVATDEGVEAIVVDPGLDNYLVSSPIPYPGGVDAVSSTPSGLRVYGVSTDNSELIEINSDPTTGLLFNTVLSTLDVGAAPKGVVVEPSGYRAYVSTDAGAIQSWDIKLGSATYQQQTNSLPTPGGAGLAGALAVTPAGDRLLALTDTGNLLFYSVQDESLLTSVAVGADARDIAVEASAERAYVTHGDGRISVVNMGGVPFKVQDIQTGGSLRGLAVTPANMFLYASDRELDDLKIVDLDVSSQTFRSVVENIEAPVNPIDVALTPDGVYALSILQGDGSPQNPARMLVTTIGAGPALQSIYPQAARIGSQIVLSGSGFGDPIEGDVTTVDFNGVTATPVYQNATQISVIVPLGATSGPVSAHVLQNDSLATLEISNSLSLEVLNASPLQTNVRAAATIQEDVDSQFEDVIAINPDGNSILVGTDAGAVIVYDIRPGSPTFHQEIDRFQYFNSQLEDIAITADGKTAYACAAGDTLLLSFVANPNDPNFGDERERVEVWPDSGPIRYVKTSPNNRVMIAATTTGAFIMGTANHFDGTPMVSLDDIGTGGGALDIAFHPSGLAAYIATRVPDAILTVDMDETSIEFGLVEGVYELPGAPAPTPMSIAVYPNGSKLLVLALQLQGPSLRTIFEYAINFGTSLSPTNTFTPSGTAGRQYQERIRISPKGDKGLRSVESSGFEYFDITNPGGFINAIGLEETLVPNEFEFTPDGNRVYMASAFHDALRAYDFTPADNIQIASGNNQTGVAGQLLTAPLRVSAGGHINDGEIFIPVVSPGIPITFTVQSGGGSLRVGDTESNAVVVSTDNQGFAQVQWRLGPSVGPQSVTAASAALNNSPLTFTATAAADPNSLPLTISEVIPLNNSQNVSVTTAVLATFSRAVSPQSIIPGSLYLELVGGAQIPAAVGFTDSNRKVSLTPISSLPYSEQIRVVYTAAIEDAVGGGLTTPGQSQFETQDAPPPSIAAISPPSALTGVPVTISGAGFNPIAANNTVNFTGSSATPFEAATNYVRVVIPPDAITGPVSVTTGAQTSNAVSYTVLVPNTSPIDDVIATIGTGSSAKSIVVSADGALCYTVSTDGDVIIPVDIEGQSTFDAILVGDQPVAIVMHPAGKVAYVANFNSGTLSAIDVDPNSPTFHTVVQTITVGTGPIDLAVTPEGDRVLVANATSGEVSVIDSDPTSLVYNQVVATVGPGSSAKSIVTSADGGLIYVGTDTGFVVIEANSYSVVATIGTGSSAKSIVTSADGTLLFILTTAGNVLIIDIQNGSPSENQVVATIGAGSSAKSIVTSADGSLLYIVQENSNEVLIIALDVIPGVGVADPNATFRIETHMVGTLVAGDDPADVAIDPQGSGRVVVANAGDRTVSVFGPGFGPVDVVFVLNPETLNPKSKGNYISGLIQVSPPRSVHEIDIATVRIFGNVYAIPGLETIGDKNEDGIADLTVMFCRPEVIAAIPPNGDAVAVVVEGTMGGDPFTGTATITVLRPKVKTPKQNENVVGGQPLAITWDTPQGVQAEKVNIEWTTAPALPAPLEDCATLTAEEEAMGAMEVALEEPNVENTEDEWQTIAFDVDNTGSFTWQTPLEYHAAARLRVTLVVRGNKAGDSEVPFAVELPVPTRLKSFDVTIEDGAAVLRWETTLETGLEGFAIVRAESETGHYADVTEVEPSGSVTGGTYEVRDDAITGNRTYWYKLREVAEDGLGAEYGPYAVTYRVVNSLAQNHPNPFNPTTTIGYSIAKDNEVSLTVYDVAGAKVRTLVNERQKADTYKVTWDGMNDTGTRVASGVYFYKLVAGSFVKTKKMVLLK